MCIGIDLFYFFTKEFCTGLKAVVNVYLNIYLNHFKPRGFTDNKSKSCWIHERVKMLLSAVLKKKSDWKRLIS